MSKLYLNPSQSRDRDPTPVENAIGDVIERCYAAGVVTREGLVSALNEAKVPAPDGKSWTDEIFEREMAKLGS